MTTVAPPSSTPPSGLVVVNARVWTNDPRRPWSDAVLVMGERILAVGSSAELRKRAGRGARIVDARGLLTLPARDGEILASGRPASLIIVEHATAEPPARPAADAVVFELIDGHIRLDRDGLAR